MSKQGMSKLFAALAVLAVAAVAAGCGEKQQVTVYKQGQYQGKPDARPWENAQFKNDQLAWEKAIKSRNAGQNEYGKAAQ